MSEHLRNSESTVIFLFGLPGSGKTCFLASILRHLFRGDYQLNFNQERNRQGAQYFMYLLETIVANKIPEITGLDENNEVDISIAVKGKALFFTFVDLSGEYLRFKDEDGNLNFNTKEKMDAYLKIEEINVILFSFFDPANPKFSLTSQDLNHFLLWEHIKSSHGTFLSLAAILTKFDKIRTRDQFKDIQELEIVESIMKTELIHSYNFIRRFKGHDCSIFSYTIGTVNEESNEIVTIDEDAASKVVDWLVAVGLARSFGGVNISGIRTFIVFILSIGLLVYFLVYEFSWMVTIGTTAFAIGTSYLYDYLKSQ